MSHTFGSIASFPIDSLVNFVEAQKSDQFLCCYNLRAKKYIEKATKKFRCEFGDRPSAQTVVVLDFDKLESSDYALRDIGDGLRERLKFSPIVVPSFSGIHAIIPLDFSVDNDEVYSFIVKSLVSKISSGFASHLDEHSFKRAWYWYHSQHFASWVQQGIVNTTKTDQGEDGRFFAEAASIGALVRYWGQVTGFIDLKTISDAALSSFYRILYTCLMRSDNESIVYTIAANFVRRILAETRRRGNPGEILSTIRTGAQALQHSPKRHVLKGELDAAICEIERLCGLDAPLENRDERGGSVRDEPAHRGSQAETPVLCSESDPEESDGNSIGCSGWDAEFAKRGFPDYSSVECVLAFVQEFSSLLRRQQLDFNRLGYVVPEDRVREHKYWGDESEEQNYVVFHGVCGQVLERYCGQSGVTPAAYVSLYEWFRYASRHMGNRRHDGRILCEFTNEIARGIRLSDTCVRAGGFQEVRKKENTKVTYDETDHLEEFASDLFNDNWQARLLSERYAKRVESFYRNHRDRFMNGLSQMFGFLCRLRNEIKDTKSLDIGIEHFEHWFGSAELASYFRRLILPMISMTNNKYRVNYKTKTWWFTDAFCQKWLPRFEAAVAQSGVLDVRSFAKKLGNGKTYETLRTGVVSVFIRAKRSISVAADFLHAALDASCANDKNDRHKEIDKYLQKIDRYRNLVAPAA